MAKIKVTLFEDKFGVGGIEKFLFNLCSNLDLDKYEINLVVVSKITDYYDSLFHSLGIKITVLLPEIEQNPMKRFKKGLPAFKHYLKLNKGQCDIMHFNLSDSIDLLYVKLAKEEGIKIRIVHSHNSSATSQKKKIIHKVGKIFLENEPNYFIACSDEAAKWLFPYNVYKKRDYLFLQNAINTQIYSFNSQKRQQMRQKLGWEDNVVYGEVARFNTQKNHRFLIEIFNEIKKKQPNAKLALIGEGELLPEVKEQVKNYNLTDAVLFLGVSDKVPDFLQAFDVFMLPSLYEGLPFALIESQAASLPALVSDTVTKEVKITDYVTFCLLDNNASEWAEKAIQLSSKKRKNTISKLEESGYDVKSMAKKVSDFYQKILSSYS